MCRRHIPVFVALWAPFQSWNNLHHRVQDFAWTNPVDRLSGVVSWPVFFCSIPNPSSSFYGVHVKPRAYRDQTCERRSTQLQQLSAASTERHVNSAPLQLSADVNSAHVQYSAVFSRPNVFNSAPSQLTADSTQRPLKKTKIVLFWWCLETFTDTNW